MPFFPNFPTEVAMSTSLNVFAQCLQQVPDPRSKYGTYHPFATILGIVFLGLLANVHTLAEIERWANIHHRELKKFLRFGKLKGKSKVPSHNTLKRVLKKLSLTDLQNAFACFLNAILQDTSLIASVDGKSAKQTKDANGNPILMLNVFAQTLKVHLASWSVTGDKTNEPGCLKQHLGELFGMFPCLKLLTGDAIYAQRPLLKAIQEYHRDYLVQVKKNQSKTYAKMQTVFKDAEHQEPNHVLPTKKRGLRLRVVCG
jgi:hypothetical protein